MTVISELLRGYENDRRKSADETERRQNQIYDMIPRVKEIDDEIAMNGLRITRTAIDGADIGLLIKELEHANEKLAAEKLDLFVSHKIPRDFLEPKFKCAVCGDTGYVGAEKCACFKQKLISAHYRYANLSEGNRDSFEMFDLSFYDKAVDPKTGAAPFDQMNRVFRDCTAFVENFDRGQRNLLLYGATGLGKTFLCSSIAKALLEKGKTVLYMTAPILFHKAEQARFHADDEDMTETRAEFFNTLFQVDLLIIDDLGTEMTTNFTLTEFFTYVNTRLIEGRSTVISTNCSLPMLEEKYSERITSRILGEYKLLQFLGNDIRSRKRGFLV